MKVMSISSMSLQTTAQQCKKKKNKLEYKELFLSGIEALNKSECRQKVRWMMHVRAQ